MSNQSHHEKHETDQIAQLLLEHYGITATTLTLMKREPNTTFHCIATNAEYLIRCHWKERRNQEALQAEMNWLQHMNGLLPTQSPVHGKQGWTTAIPESLLPLHLMTVLEWVPGQIIPSDERTHFHYKAVSHLLAKLHHIAEAAGPLYTPRPCMDSETMIATLDDLHINEATLQLVSQVLNQLLQAEKTIGRNDEQFGLVHGDPSFGNVIFHDQHASLIDFEDSGFGYYLFDIATVLAGAWSREDYSEVKQVVLNSYAEIRPLPDYCDKYLPFFMAQRAIWLIIWSGQHPKDHWSHEWIPGQVDRIHQYLDRRI